MLLQRAFTATPANRRFIVANKMFRQQALMSQIALRQFHAGGHDHSHEDDGHDDFKAKKKTPEAYNEEKQFALFKEWINANDIVLFMKGNKKMPRCGFSNYVT